MTKRNPVEQALGEAALAGARELKKFLERAPVKDENFQRAKIALGAVKSYAQFRASENNLKSMIIAVSKMAGLPPEITLDIAKDQGLIPNSVESRPLKVVK